MRFLQSHLLASDLTLVSLLSQSFLEYFGGHSSPNPEEGVGYRRVVRSELIVLDTRRLDIFYIDSILMYLIAVVDTSMNNHSTVSRRVEDINRVSSDQL